jgi:flagellar biosynthesis protein FlhB
MAQDSGMDRTEKPTAKKLADARKKGQIAQSREIPSALILMTSLAVFYFGGRAMAQQLADLMRLSFRNLGGDWIQNIGSVNLMMGWLFDQTLVAPDAHDACAAGDRDCGQCRAVWIQSQGRHAGA